MSGWSVCLEASTSALLGDIHRPVCPLNDVGLSVVVEGDTDARRDAHIGVVHGEWLAEPIQDALRNRFGFVLTVDSRKIRFQNINLRIMSDPINRSEQRRSERYLPSYNCSVSGLK